MNLPHELFFLQEHLNDQASFYNHAEWLLSPFPAPSWQFDFGFKKGPQELKWDTMLSDGRSLVDPKHSDLLESFKYWLIASTTPQSGGISNNLKVQYAEFNRTLHLIDFLVLNDDRFQISRYGMAALSGDDLKAILARIASNRTVSESLFKWSERLVEFASDLLDTTSVDDIEVALNQIDGLSVITPNDEDEARELGIDKVKLPRLRAALEVNGYTLSNRRLGHAPNSSLISQKIYTNTVRVRFIDKPAIACFSFNKNPETHVREFGAVDVTTGSGDSISKVVFQRYLSNFYNLGILHELNYKAPMVEDLLTIKNFRANLKDKGRFRTIPSTVVFSSVKNAIEFHIDHGRDILNGYLRLAVAAQKRNCLISKLSDEEFEKAIGPELQLLGVTELNHDYRVRGMDAEGFDSEDSSSKSIHFESLRANKKLLPLVLVYFGATQLVVGALTARRVGELQELRVGSTLDESRTWIVFQNRKSTNSLMGLRSTEARPLEPIGAKMVAEIERFQKILNRIGFGQETNLLFSSPSARNDTNNRIAASPFSYNKHLDEFCDYFEIPLNSEGNRYYIRQHQLRRFFALLFFHSSSFGGLETLQWMLGHTDLSHVWHYITESMSGKVLRGAKSQFVAESLRNNGSESFKDLAELLKSRYGTDDFSLLDSDELEDYISDLLEDGEIEIEPEFFTDSEGEKLEVIVRIRERSVAET